MKTYPVPPRIVLDLKSLEISLEAVLASYQGDLREPAEHVVRAGGKRLRPALVLISGQAGDYAYERLEPIALSAELLHTATLVHDDVLDAAAERRGNATVNSRWSEPVALATGNMLLAASFAALCDKTSPRVMASMTTTAELLSAGETMQQRALRDTNLSIEDYTRRVCFKTASLFAACCELGGAAGGATDADTRALKQYGECLGLAFQVFDDVLDIVAEEAKLGKPVGADVRDGTVTLPAIYALAAETSGELKAIIEDPAVSEDAVSRALELIVANGGVERAKADAGQYVRRALEAIEHVSRKALKNELTAIGEFVIDRYN
jgi:heptaprenyl diphosphate synthase